jgi:hypothetical protein
MARAGPFTIPDPLPEVSGRRLQALDPEPVLLPPRPILDAGYRKFNELARQCWPNAKCDGLISFDPKNPQQLMYVLGLVYMAMRDADTNR